MRPCLFDTQFNLFCGRLGGSGTLMMIQDVFGTFTGYPFIKRAEIVTEDKDISNILDIGWRTARLCAMDTYMDCPYYERLQYVGDTRIQHLISFYNSGDDRLIKNSLNLLDYSRRPDGYTLSRYPDTEGQVIPTYSLWYIGLLYDYLMYGNDIEFLKEKLMGSRQVLNYFISYMDSDGSLKKLPGWNFTDWVPEWEMGQAPMAHDGSSALLDLQLLLALQSGLAIEKELGQTSYVEFYQMIIDKLIATIKRKYWQEHRQLFSDTESGNSFSQHANALAILAGLVDDEVEKKIGRRLLDDGSLTQASIYFKYYLHQALNEAGYGDRYLDWLNIWRKNMALGLSTWGETSEIESTRSDCHAWGASPNIEFFRIVLGIQSASPWFKSVRIEPKFGNIHQIAGEMPHPKGKISVKYFRSKSKFEANISLPEDVTGIFLWNGKNSLLHPGENHFVFDE